MHRRRVALADRGGSQPKDLHLGPYACLAAKEDASAAATECKLSKVPHFQKRKSSRGMQGWRWKLHSPAAVQDLPVGWLKSLGCPEAAAAAAVGKKTHSQSMFFE